MLAPPDILESSEDGGKGGGYCGEDFTDDRGVIQVDPLSPTIFNVVVGAVVCYWVAVPMESTEEPG